MVSLLIYHTCSQIQTGLTALFTQCVNNMTAEQQGGGAINYLKQINRGRNVTSNPDSNKSQEVTNQTTSVTSQNNHINHMGYLMRAVPRGAPRLRVFDRSVSWWAIGLKE